MRQPQLLHKQQQEQQPQQRRQLAAHASPFDKLRALFSGSSGSSSGAERDAAPGTQQQAGGELQPIDAVLSSEEDVLGPLAVLLVGFQRPEYEAFCALMQLQLEADMVKVVPCTAALMGASLRQACESEFPAWEQPPLGTRRAMFFSGMYGSEVMEVISAYRDAGLPPCAFAAAVPNNWGRPVAELVAAIWEDQAAMAAKQAARQAAAAGGSEEEQG